MTFRKFLRRFILSRLKQLVARQERARYLTASKQPRLNVGCGHNMPEGWLNTDIYPLPRATFMDAGKSWPFKENTFDAVLCEHMIEHVPKDLGQRLLKEAFRTLKPGGKIRVITPDPLFFAKMLLQPMTKDELQYLKWLGEFSDNPATTRCDAINQIFYGHGHVYIFSPEELKLQMENCGFKITAETRAGVADAPVFVGAEGHPERIGFEVNALEAFAIEATKP